MRVTGLSLRHKSLSECTLLMPPSYSVFFEKFKKRLNNCTTPCNGEMRDNDKSSSIASNCKHRKLLHILTKNSYRRHWRLARAFQITCGQTLLTSPSTCSSTT
eukprot:XP_001707968.1 Hypothetical protein GL50803_18927 [Giardia lamblia ATCC 50803]